MLNEIIKKINIFMIIIGIIIIISMVNISSALDSDCILYHKYVKNITISNDYSGNNHHGILYNIENKNGIYNGCVIFNGADSKITVNDSDLLSFSDNTNDNPFSINFWVNHEYFYEQPILEKGEYINNNGEYAVGIIHDEYKGVFWITDSLTGTYLQCLTDDDLSSFDNINGWIMYSCTYSGIGDQTGMQIYVNGNLISTTNTKVGGVYNCMQNSNDNLTIGTQNYTGIPTFLKGNLDELKIYKKELTPGEIEYLFNGYINSGYFLTLLPKNNLNVQHNISVFKNDEFIKTINYGESILYNNTYDYTFIIHEDITDEIAHIENINTIAENNISYIVYIIIIFMIIGLIIYFVRR